MEEDTRPMTQSMTPTRLLHEVKGRILLTMKKQQYNSTWERLNGCRPESLGSRARPSKDFRPSLGMAALVAVGRARAQEALKDLDSAEDDNAMRMPADKDCILMGQFGRKVIG